MQETARQTEAFRELDEDRKRQLDEKLAMISQMLSDKKEIQVRIMCFVRMCAKRVEITGNIPEW